MAKKAKNKSDNATEQPKVWGDPEYSAKDDIYNRAKKEEDIDPDDGFIIKGKKEKQFKDDDDLDVPGAELDDEDEEIGEEDEENNYYSLGGDNHDDLEEDKGD